MRDALGEQEQDVNAHVHVGGLVVAFGAGGNIHGHPQGPIFRASYLNRNV